MKINNISINGVGGIEQLTIPFDPQMNIICGPNGIGKTTILESIAHCFSHGETTILKRHVKANISKITADIQHEGKPVNITIQFNQFEPTENATIQGHHQESQYLLSLKTTRTFAYVPLNSVNRDTKKEVHVLWNEARNGVSLQDIKNWFVNRYLYSAHDGALTHDQMDNFNLAKRCFSALNNQFSFCRVNASSNEILVKTPSGEIYYEYLSSGFKSCLSILFGIIKEIEFRFPSASTKAETFEGIVLIDELELHLHPEWQYKISKVLTDIFPKIQFIVTTHSPHIIQSADPNQIIALENLNGETVLRPLPPSRYGFKGWTLDEVLTDVMGMTDTRTKVFVDLLDKFNKSIDDENHTEASRIYQELDALLHPLNHTRKLLKLQLASIGSVNT